MLQVQHTDSQQFMIGLSEYLRLETLAMVAAQNYG